MKEIEIDGLQFELFISSKKIQQKISSLSSLLKNEYNQNWPIFLIVLNGAAVFAHDLLNGLDPLIEISLIKVKSYDGINSSGEIKVDYFPYDLVKNKNILLIEDIVDTGLTLDFLKKEIIAHGAKEVRCITLLFKPNKYKYKVEPDYIGFRISDEFVVGYGMDFNQRGRKLKNIYKNIINQN